MKTNLPLASRKVCLKLPNPVLNLDDITAPLDRIHEDEPALEVRITRPRPHKIDNTTTSKSIIIRIDIEKRNLLNTLACRVARNARDIENTETAAVVRLEGETTNDVLIMINTPRAALIEARLLGLLK